MTNITRRLATLAGVLLMATALDLAGLLVAFPEKSEGKGRSGKPK
jgi:hypothetical protein